MAWVERAMRSGISFVIAVMRAVRRLVDLVRGMVTSDRDRRGPPGNGPMALRSLLRDRRVALVTTRDIEGTLHVQPMAASNREFDGALWFATSESAPVLDHVLVCPDVQVTYIDDAANRSLVLDGIACAYWGADLTGAGARLPGARGRWRKLAGPGGALIRVEVVGAQVLEQ